MEKERAAESQHRDKGVRRKAVDLPAVVEEVREKAAAVEASVGEIEFQFRGWKGPGVESWATYRMEALAEFEKALLELGVRAGLDSVGE
jgi:hypothetical protein